MEQPASTVIPVTPEQRAAVEAMLHQPTLPPRQSARDWRGSRPPASARKTPAPASSTPSARTYQLLLSA